MVGLLGDIHGFTSPITRWINELSSEGDTLIQVGDAGFGWVSKNVWEYLGSVAKKKNVNILIIRGNHDDPAPFRDNYKTGNLECIPDYTYRTIEGLDFLFIGGAISIDRFDRTQGINYWEDEVVDYDLNKIVDGASYVVTHTLPSLFELMLNSRSILDNYSKNDPTLLDDLKEEREYMNNVYYKLSSMKNIKKWIGGHFHVDSSGDYNGTNYTCLGICSLHQLYV